MAKHNYTKFKMCRLEENYICDICGIDGTLYGVFKRYKNTWVYNGLEVFHSIKDLKKRVHYIKQHRKINPKAIGPMVYCPRCQKWKSKRYFYKCKCRNSGTQTLCKKCRNTEMKIRSKAE